MLGNGRLEAHCMDGVRRLGNIRGSTSPPSRSPTNPPPSFHTHSPFSPDQTR